ncbi:beta-1,3-glucan-binding protein-like [Biomphalaria glabrata]|uniref:Beta-1,3-glucan-binding protein-like n=1 Tax=Biomphalaria glabrata TaxID=6526 RepID=A0A9W3AY35_BIOGL|nr:beta-1,3-glucan-binding protein-like [Biomphalaria glabrata]
MMESRQVVGKFSGLMGWHNLLIALVIAVCAASKLELSFVPPVLTFTLPVDDQEISQVEIMFKLNNEFYQLSQASPSSGGWQFKTSAIKLEPTDVIHAYTTTYGQDGKLKEITEQKQFTLNSLSAVEMPSPRRISAVVFRDDFNSFDKSQWNFEVSMYGGYNGEFQVYTNDPKNVFVRDGQLHIHPMPTVDDPRFDENCLYHGHMDMNALFGMCTISDLDGCVRDGNNGILPPVMSGKVLSVPTIKFGTVEVRAKIPRGDWLWPAIWMMPVTEVYGTWPRSGEIDIMESWGNIGDIGVKTVTSTLHWGPSADQNRASTTHGERKSSNWHNDFHVWRLEWTQEHILTFVDNQQIMSVTPPDGGFWQKGGFSGYNLWASGSKMAPFDLDFYIMFNVAVGGTKGFFPDGNHYDGVTKPWNNNSPRAMEEFWRAHGAWGPTWQGDNSDLIIDYVEFKSL